MASAADCFKVVVVLLLIHCLLLFPLSVGVLYLALVLLCSSQCPFQFCNHLAEEERAGCFTLIVFLLSCGY